MLTPTLPRVFKLSNGRYGHGRIKPKHNVADA